jgi:leader peptidase (prepilin peptidase)/N-methyltransferase
MPDLMIPVALAAALVASLFGLVVGSFANVVIHRLPLDQSIVFPSSRCPVCQAAIRPWQNIPVISWLLLRGRCASCGAPISLRYPVVEALHGLGFALIVWRFALYPFTPFLLFFFFALVVLAFIDWDHQILPDAITLPGILIGIFGAFLPGSLVGWREAAAATVFGYLAFFLVAEGYARLRGIEGLGQGDWKLAAMMGAFLGVHRLMLVVFLASLTGMTYGLVQALRLKRRALEATPLAAAPELAPIEAMSGTDPDSAAPARDPAAAPDEPVSIGKYKLPFGTFLAASALIVLFWGDPVILWYASLFRFE